MKLPTLTFLGRAGEYRPVRSLITISGDSEVMIENCRRILECSDIKCSVISAGYLVEVWGMGLTASSFANGSAGVSGRVQSISIERRGRNGGAEIK